MVLNATASYPHNQTFVLKLHRDAAPQQGSLCGRLEHVASGHQFLFASGDELIACLSRFAALEELVKDEVES
jgi:hypothetical protein